VVNFSRNVLIAFIAKGRIDFFAYYFFGAGVVTLLFYPIYQKYRYKKHFSKFIAENYQYRFGKECVIDFQPDFIYSKDITGESTINTKEIFQISEINTHFFMKLKSGEALIIPKALVPEKTFLLDLTAIFQNPDIVINKELDWQWK
jgi:hypothetical protein